MDVTGYKNNPGPDQVVFFNGRQAADTSDDWE